MSEIIGGLFCRHRLRMKRQHGRGIQKEGGVHPRIIRMANNFAGYYYQ